MHGVGGADLWLWIRWKIATRNCNQGNGAILCALVPREVLSIFNILMELHQKMCFLGYVFIEELKAFQAFEFDCVQDW